MALNNYLTLTEDLLQNPQATVALYDPAQLTIFINQARVWLAGDSASIKQLGSYALTPDSQGPYPFSGITIPNAATLGVQGVLNVRQQWYSIGTGQLWFRGRPWPWFSFYHLNSAAPDTGPPGEWSQYGDGEGGSVYIGPAPDQAYTVSADCICVPVPLVDDSTPEAIPAPWTIAVPYYAAYLALLAAQAGARVQDAQRMLQLYNLFMTGSRRISTPDIMPSNFSGQDDPTRENKLGAGGGGQPQQQAPG